jgi:uncharacterized membrane protein YozB (DUF420 family)
MATIASPAIARWRNDRIFYTGTGVYLALLTFTGFSRSFYLSRWFEQSPNTAHVGPLLAVHGIVFSLWMVLMALQPALIASRRRELHRKLGWAGAVLAVLMVVLGNLAAIAAMHDGFKGLGDPFAFYAIAFFAIWTFAIMVALAVLWRDRAETHKRLMVLASVALVEAATARLPLGPLMAGAPFVFFLAGDLVIFAGIGYDIATRRRIHPVWLWGGGAVIASQILKLFVSQTAPWLAFAHAMAGLWPA